MAFSLTLGSTHLTSMKYRITIKENIKLEMKKSLKGV
jgi:hypothetical protein